LIEHPEVEPSGRKPSGGLSRSTPVRRRARSEPPEPIRDQLRRQDDPTNDIAECARPNRERQAPMPWYCCYGISYRGREEMLGERGVAVDHTTPHR
jgi:hypothetical protein